MNQPLVARNSAKRPKRPLCVSLLAFVVLIFTSLHLVRFVQVLSLWDFLSQLLEVSPIYLAGVGLFWGLVGLVLLWGLWRGSPFAPRATRLAALVYAMYYWIDRVWFVKSS